MTDAESEKPEAGGGEELKAIEVKHLAVVEEARGEKSKKPKSARRGAGWQKGRRELERRVREGAVEYRSSVVMEGGMRKEAAEQLGLSTRTLGEWASRVKEGWGEAKPRGRPIKDSGRLHRNNVIAFLREKGPAVGVGTVRAVFPEMGRCEIIDVLARFRRVYVRHHQLVVHELHWKVVNAVWGMDHAEPPNAIEGRFGAIFSTRDLASGHQIHWQPVATQGAQEVISHLDQSFSSEGAPLVLKSDNGSAFRDAETKELLARHGVIQLLSPPGFPQYNGSVEAGIGAMKDRTAWKATLAGRPREWTRDDVAAARTDANELPREPNSPSPAERWRNRTPIETDVRAALHASVAKEKYEERAARGRGWGAVADPLEDAEIERTATYRALVAHGLLEIRRRRIPLPKRLLRRAKKW